MSRTEIAKPRGSLLNPASFLACLLLISCASRDSVSSNGPDYSTAYLGPNGEICYASTSGSKKPSVAAPSPEAKWSWWGDGVPGRPSIIIDISEQNARFYKGGNLVGVAPVSTGREGFHTPTGSFSVIQKNADHISTLYGDYVDADGNVVVSNVGVNQDRRPPGTKFQGAPMPFFMRVTGAVGMHAGFLPGYPASHGCIRLPRGAAEKFFENAPGGTRVSITH